MQVMRGCVDVSTFILAAVVLLLVALLFLGTFGLARASARAELAVLEADPADLMGPVMAARFAEYERRLVDAVRSIDNLDVAVEEALAVANAEPVDPYELQWRRYCDPDSPDYSAIAEWWNNIHPDLRRGTS